MMTKKPQTTSCLPKKPHYLIKCGRQTTIIKITQLLDMSAK